MLSKIINQIVQNWFGFGQIKAVFGQINIVLDNSKTLTPCNLFWSNQIVLYKFSIFWTIVIFLV